MGRSVDVLCLVSQTLHVAVRQVPLIGFGATGEQHRQVREKNTVPVFSFDYLIITRENVVIKDGDEDAEAKIMAKILVARDSKSKAVFAHAVQKKGADADGYAADCLVGDLKWLGYGHVLLKSDNEKAIIKLLGVTPRQHRITCAEVGEESII